MVASRILGTYFDIWTQHVQRSVQHFNQIGCVHAESLAGQKFGRISVHIDRETKEDFCLRALLEQAISKERRPQ